MAFRGRKFWVFFGCFFFFNESGFFFCNGSGFFFSIFFFPLSYNSNPNFFSLLEYFSCEAGNELDQQQEVEEEKTRELPPNTKPNKAFSFFFLINVYQVFLLFFFYYLFIFFFWAQFPLLFWFLLSFLCLELLIIILDYTQVKLLISFVAIWENIITLPYH